MTDPLEVSVAKAFSVDTTVTAPPPICSFDPPDIARTSETAEARKRAFAPSAHSITDPSVHNTAKPVLDGTTVVALHDANSATELEFPPSEEPNARVQDNIAGRRGRRGTVHVGSPHVTTLVVFSIPPVFNFSSQQNNNRGMPTSYSKLAQYFFCLFEQRKNTKLV